MKPVLLTDFGSTYTKLTAVDLERERILGTASAYTTVEEDIMIGMTKALEELEKQVGPLEYQRRYACSSAAGGLKMIASGLMPELTVSAARQATLGAGAKVMKVYAFKLTEEDAAEIRRSRPDILLLVGGIDGGNAEVIVHNAGMLAALPEEWPIVVAGNRNAAGECRRLLEGHQVYVCENVMPKFGVLNTGPSQERIREIFLDRIIQAKGLSEAAALQDGPMIPTPASVMAAMELLARGLPEDGEEGLGELMAVDVGGATTDVYSVADGRPEDDAILYQGLPEPYVKRTVEGDIGMRYSVRGILEAAGAAKLARLSGLTEERVLELVEYLRERTDALPDGDRELEALDFALASAAVETAMGRHAGHLEEIYTGRGLTCVQTGKDLTKVSQIVVTGGSLIHSPRAREIAARGLFNAEEPLSLRPKSAGVLVDRRYILAAMGLLAPHYPKAALRIMKKELAK